MATSEPLIQPPTSGSAVMKAAPWAIYGLVLLVFIYLMPGGVAWMVVYLRQRLGRVRRPASSWSRRVVLSSG